MLRNHKVLAVAVLLAAFATGAAATESIEFVAEHLPEIAMDNRYASLPLWNACDTETSGGHPDRAFCPGIGVAYALTHSGTLSIDGPMFTLSLARPVGKGLRLTGFVFFDDLTLSSGVENRPLAVSFSGPPLTLPAAAQFTGLDGKARDAGFGLALNGSANISWFPGFEWSAGLLWQQFKLSDYRFDYLITEGPDAGTTGTLDYSATYSHISPFAGAAWPRVRGAWRYTPHVQLAIPLPRRGVEGRITGPAFDLQGSTADNGDKPFGDPSVTIGFNITYVPWDLTVDFGSTITQALFEPLIHEGVKQNLMLSTHWTF